MTACAVEATAGDGGTTGHNGLVIAADGSYGARLTRRDDAEGGWFAERWTLDGPEPYAVPLPADTPEEPGTQVLPLADGRVLVARRETGAHRLALLYPSGPATGELALGAVDSEWLTLLPPTPCGRLAYALVTGSEHTGVWLVAGGDDGPRRVAEVAGRCTGGVWLDREARLLALDRTEPGTGPGGRGRTKTVAVDLGRGGGVSPLLQIADDSDDRLLLADPDSGLLLLRSDAPGEERLGWGVLGSSLLVRFPQALRPEGVRLMPFASQPGQALLPERCGVALRADGPNGTWAALWRPAHRTLQHVAAPHGWLTGTGLWTAGGELRLPFATAGTAYGLAHLEFAPDAERGAAEDGPAPVGPAQHRPAQDGPARGAEGERPGPPGEPGAPAAPGAPTRPVPLQQAPMARW